MYLPIFDAMVTQVVIGITGCSGSGKSSLVRELKSVLPADSVSVLTQDDYYFPIEKQERDIEGKVNFDLPGAIDLKKFASDLDLLKKGESVELIEYVFNHSGKHPIKKQVKPTPIVLAEGLFILNDENVKNRLDHSFFVESDIQQQLIRRVTRDINERGYSREAIRYQWKNHVMPAYEQYILPYRDDCDLVLSNTGELGDCVQEALDYLAIRIGLPMASAQLL